jgi:hypothetical protein
MLKRAIVTTLTSQKSLDADLTSASFSRWFVITDVTLVIVLVHGSPNQGLRPRSPRKNLDLQILVRHQTTATVDIGQRAFAYFNA